MSKKEEGSSNEQFAFKFINITDPEAIKDPRQQQFARTQAIKNSLQRKRRQLQLTHQNFVDETQTLTRRRSQQDSQQGAASSSTPLPRGVATSSLDPFASIAIDSVRLTTLLQTGSARQAGDPVFRVNGAAEFQGLLKVFDAGLEDGPLASALCLVLAFAANGGQMDEECTSYRLGTIRFINEKLSDPSQAATSATIGAVLLLVGIEARLGERETTQTHLNGVRQLLILYNEREVVLNHAIKRAIFWQDLFCSMITGTTRVFSHDTFAELHWHRDPFATYLYSIPAGFASRVEVLGAPFTEIIGDICALQRLRERATQTEQQSDRTERIDNQQASIESRLEELRHAAIGRPLLLCCIPAAFLCAFGFFTDIWSGSVIPSRVSALLLRELQAAEAWSGWDDHADLLLWLLNIGAAFAVDAHVRQGLAELCNVSHRTRLEPISQSWEEIERILKSFIWSEAVHGQPCGAFWQRLHDL